MPSFDGSPYTESSSFVSLANLIILTVELSFAHRISREPFDESVQQLIEKSGVHVLTQVPLLKLHTRIVLSVNVESNDNTNSPSSATFNTSTGASCPSSTCLRINEID